MQEKYRIKLKENILKIMKDCKKTMFDTKKYYNIFLRKGKIEHLIKCYSKITRLIFLKNKEFEKIF